MSFTRPYTRDSRTRSKVESARCYSVFSETNRMASRIAASQIASAFTKPFASFLTKGTRTAAR